MKDCQYFIELISAELDGEATQEQCFELAAHLEDCAYCRGIYEMLHGCSAILDDTMAEPPESLCENVMGEIRRAELRKKRSRRSLLALAACAAIVIIGGVSIMGTLKAGRSGAAVYNSMAGAVSESASKEICESAAAPAAACAPEEDFDAGLRDYEYALSEEPAAEERAAGAYMQNYANDLARQCVEIYLTDDEILAYISEKETSLPEAARLYAKLYIPQNNEYLSILLYLDGEEAYCESVNKICKIEGLNASDIFCFVEMHSFSQ